MINFVIAVICGYALASKIQRLWVGAIGSIICGTLVGLLATYLTLRVQDIPAEQITAVVVRASILFTAVCLLFFVLGRWRHARKLRKRAASDIIE